MTHDLRQLHRINPAHMLWAFWKQKQELSANVRISSWTSYSSKEAVRTDQVLVPEVVQYAGGLMLKSAEFLGPPNDYIFR
jgi:hypothetical protein